MRAGRMQVGLGAPSLCKRRMAKLPGPESAGRVPPLLSGDRCLWTIKCITEQSDSKPDAEKSQYFFFS